MDVIKGLPRTQRLILILIAAGDIVVLLLACIIISTGLPKQSDIALVQPITLQPTSTPTRTPIPTWTPTVTPTPYVPATPTLRPLKEEEAALLEQAEQETAALRDLPILQPVPRWKITRTQLRQRYTDVFVSDEWEETARSLVYMFAALDFMPPDTDLVDLWEDSFSDWVAGFYLADMDEIYIVSDAYTIGAMERSIFAHEFVHALQDQHFDLASLGLDVTDDLGYGDRQLAVQALIEGDAELLQEQYIETFFSEQDMLDYVNEALKFTFTWTDSTPRVLSEVSLFPYEQGKEFASALYQQGGWQAVSDAYANPPVSTEQILHPRRYLSDDQPVPVSLPSLADTLGGEWRLIYDGPAGELLLRLYLENHLDPTEAARAAEGWGGDHCLVYHDDATGGTVALLQTIWDTSNDRREFLNAYLSYGEARFDHEADQTSDGLACWQEVDALCVAWGEENVTVALGPGQETVDQVLAVFSSP
jgi:hypothetical protein